MTSKWTTGCPMRSPFRRRAAPDGCELPLGLGAGPKLIAAGGAAVTCLRRSQGYGPPGGGPAEPPLKVPSALSTNVPVRVRLVLLCVLPALLVAALPATAAARRAPQGFY